MAEELKEKQSENYQFINEKIVPKRKKKWLKRLGTVLFVICMAVIFGVVSQAVFLLSGDYLKELFGIEDERLEVELPKPTSPARITFSPTPKPTRKPTPTPTKQPTPVPTEAPTITEAAEVTPEATPEALVTPEATPDIEPESTITPGAEVTPEPTQVPGGSESAEEKPVNGGVTQSYLQMYESIRQVAGDVSNAFVTVEAVEQGVDWFQEVYENRTRTTGLVLGNDGVDLLILVGTEQFSGATSIEVSFGEEVIAGSIYSMDKDYGLAIIAVPLEQISAELSERIELGIVASEEDIVVGTPVIAVGAPNGYEGSLEFGMITSLGSTVSVTDGEVAYFTTNIMEYANGHGFVVNLEGKILGLITHSNETVCSRDIENHFDLTHPTVCGILKRLESKGMIYNKQSEMDKRVKNIFITEKTKKLDENIHALIKENENKITDILSENEHDFLKIILKKMYGRLKEEEYDQNISKTHKRI